MLGIPAQIHVAEHAFGAALQQLAEVGHQARQQRLALGVAEADVELEQLRAGRGEHQPGVQDAPIRGALGGHAGDRGRTISAIARSVSAGVMQGAGA